LIIFLFFSPFFFQFVVVTMKVLSSRGEIVMLKPASGTVGNSGFASEAVFQVYLSTASMSVIPVNCVSLIEVRVFPVKRFWTLMVTGLE